VNRNVSLGRLDEEQELQIAVASGQFQHIEPCRDFRACHLIHLYASTQSAMPLIEDSNEE